MEPLIPPRHPLRARLLAAGYLVHGQDQTYGNLLISGPAHIGGFYLSPTLAEYFLQVDVSRLPFMTNIDSLRDELVRAGVTKIVWYDEGRHLLRMLRLLCS